MNNSQINIQMFDMNHIQHNSNILIVGKRQTGKTFLTRDILYHKRDTPAGIVVSLAERVEHIYEKFFPKIFIHDEFKPELFHNMSEWQNKIINRNKQKNMKKIKCLQLFLYKMINILSFDMIQYIIKNYLSHIVENPNSFCVLDNCMYDKSWMKDKNISEIFQKKVLFIITAGYCFGIPRSLQQNIDFVFILHENIVNNKKKLYQQYGNIFPSFHIFLQIMNHFTNNYGCLVIHNTSKSNKLEERIFWYKAKNHDNFKVGSPELWRYNFYF